MIREIERIARNRGFAAEFIAHGDIEFMWRMGLQVYPTIRRLDAAPFTIATPTMQVAMNWQDTGVRVFYRKIAMDVIMGASNTALHLFSEKPTLAEAFERSLSLVSPDDLEFPADHVYTGADTVVICNDEEADHAQEIAYELEAVLHRYGYKQERPIWLSKK